MILIWYAKDKGEQFHTSSVRCEEDCYCRCDCHASSPLFLSINHRSRTCIKNERSNFRGSKDIQGEQSGMNEACSTCSAKSKKWVEAKAKLWTSFTITCDERYAKQNTTRQSLYHHNFTSTLHLCCSRHNSLITKITLCKELLFASICCCNTFVLFCCFARSCQILPGSESWRHPSLCFHGNLS